MRVVWRPERVIWLALIAVALAAANAWVRWPRRRAAPVKPPGLVAEAALVARYVGDPGASAADLERELDRLAGRVKDPWIDWCEVTPG